MQFSNLMTDLKDTVVLITGAGGGFGREMMRQFAAAGCRLIVHDIDETALRKAIDETLDDPGAVLKICAADLSDAKGCDFLHAAVTADGYLPDIVVNNAGIGVGGRLDLVPNNRWEQVLQVNLLSPMRTTRLFLPAMIARRSGHFVNISSMAGWVGASGLTAYVASKFGLRGFGESLQNDVREFGIKVTTVYPWFSKTPILESDQFGPDDNLKVPDELLTDPAEVVAEIVAGTRADRENVFPDRMARRVQFLKRHFPALLGVMMRRLEKKMESEAAA